jgi:hypothetical protein
VKGRRKDAFAKAYYRALDLPRIATNAVEEAPSKAALNRAHELRQFEIENYWKRANYFWLFQLAAFTFDGLALKDFESSSVGPISKSGALLFAAELVSITAQVGYLTARGSKFWQENWEAHVDMLETQHEGRLTQTILYKGKLKSSVSRINERLYALLAMVWVVAFVVVACPDISTTLKSISPVWAIVLLFSAMIFVAAGTTSNMKGPQYIDSHGDFWPWQHASLTRWIKKVTLAFCCPLSEDKPTILLRDTKGVERKSLKP